MRTIFPLLLIALGGITRAMEKNTAEVLVVEARQAYAAGEHQEALLLFDSVRTAYTSAGLLHNIANCHFKLDNIPQAILFYERALRLAPGADDIRMNLELARSFVVDRVNEMPRFSFESTLRDMLGGGDIDQWARRAIWIWIIALGLFAGAWAARNGLQRRILISLGTLALIGTFASVSLAYLRYADLNDDSEAIILSPALEVRSEPHNGGAILFVLHKGTKVTILDQVDDHLEVSLLNGSVGWVPSSALERI